MEANQLEKERHERLVLKSTKLGDYVEAIRRRRGFKRTPCLDEAKKFLNDTELIQFVSMHEHDDCDKCGTYKIVTVRPVRTVVVWEEVPDVLVK